MAPELTVISTSERAGRHLRATKCWTVVSRFRRSFYVRSGDTFLCVGRPDVGHGPLNVIVRSHAPLDIDQACTFNVTGAAIFGRPAWPPAFADALAPDRLKAVLHAGLAAAPADSFIAAKRAANDADGPLSRRAALGMTALQQGDLAIAVTTLAGLGHGLTPSGDDVLAGAMLTLHALGKRDEAAALADTVRRLAPSRTSPLSYALLEPACDGEPNEAVAKAILALLAGKPPQAVVHHLARVGATSGFDILAGMLVAAGI